MKHDPQGGGTSADGNRTQAYCSYCYQNGRFAFNGTVSEFQEICRKKNGRGRAWRVYARYEAAGTVERLNAMARATTKTDLRIAPDRQFGKPWELIDGMGWTPCRKAPRLPAKWRR